uniref:Uncharacterized protein n=1 Tax=Octactis speculum TaxID=3111310 RepID=A0A7S2DF11_9STRA|mmetsp:Transcript_47980/g.65329  ORF Transcript_47980/g.65329 Transcript_47980/m.65329 type:complete len:256 (+) Transcript_47980:536-1303(+)
MPALSGNDNFDGSAFSTDSLFVILILTALIFGLCPHTMPFMGPDGECGTFYQGEYSIHLPGLAVMQPIPLTQFLSIIFSWTALVIPFCHIWSYLWVRRCIQKRSSGDDFVGKPPSNDIPFEKLKPFAKNNHDKSQLDPSDEDVFADKKFKPNECLKEHDQFKLWRWKSTGKKTASLSRGKLMAELESFSERKYDRIVYAILVFVMLMMWSIGEHVPRTTDEVYASGCDATRSRSPLRSVVQRGAINVPNTRRIAH